MKIERYLEIRNNPNADTNEVYFFYYNLKGGKPMPPDAFFQLFWIWVLQVMGSGIMSRIQYKVFKELDEHFKINIE